MTANYNRGAHEAFEFHAPRLIAARHDSATARATARNIIRLVRKHRADHAVWEATRITPSGDGVERI